MSLKRREFIKTLFIAGSTTLIGKKLFSAKPADNDTEFYGILYDATRCACCQGCEFACAEANNLPEPTDVATVEEKRKTSTQQRTVVNIYETTKDAMPAKIQCMHCNQPACTAACLTEAMHKTKEGPVIWREEKCMGCRYCMIACPFDVPKFEYYSTNPKIQKCNMCYDRIKEGNMPACVENCPAEALLFETRREVLNEAKHRIVEDPELYENYIYGEHEAGGTAIIYLSPVPFDEIGFKTNIQKKSYPALTKGFISSIAPVDILLPAVLLGIHEATKSRTKSEEEE